MTTIETTPGQRLKQTIDQDNLQAKLVEEVEKRITEDKEANPISDRELLGLLVQPFSGIDAPAVHSGSDDTCDKVLEAIIYHFAGQRNLEKLPGHIRSIAANTLYHLHATMMRFRTYDNLLFEYANLHRLNQWEKMTADDKQEFISWYL